VSAFAAYPEKTVTMVVPFPPGGSTDAIARVLAQKLQEKLGGRPSRRQQGRRHRHHRRRAGEARRRPTATPVLVSSLGPLVIAPHLIKGVQYDALKDLDPITVAVQAPNVLVVPASSPHKSVADVLAFEKKPSGQDELRLVRQRLQRPPVGRAVLAADRHRAACTSRTRAAAPPSTTCWAARSMPRSSNINSGHPAHQGRQAARAGIVTRRQALRCCRTCRRWGAGRQGRGSLFLASRGRAQGPAGRRQAPSCMTPWSGAERPGREAKLLAQGFEIVANTPEAVREVPGAEFARWKKVIEDRKITAD
jgi:hypothetical protein